MIRVSRMRTWFSSAGPTMAFSTTCSPIKSLGVRSQRSLGLIRTVINLEPELKYWSERGGRQDVLDRLDYLVSWSLYSDVYVSYAYGTRRETPDTPVADALRERGVFGKSPRLRDKPSNHSDGTGMALAALYVSNCGSPWRQAYLTELLKHLPVDSYGGCFHSDHLSGSSDKVGTIRKYKFFLSPENALMTDYMTEKFFQGAETDAVTVYFGPPNADAYFPGGRASMINGWDFPDPRALADHLQKVADDERAWEAHFQWRHTGKLNPLYEELHTYDFVREGRHGFICRTCMHYHMHHDVEETVPVRLLRRAP